jgi:hypothetical protein
MRIRKAAEISIPAAAAIAVSAKIKSAEIDAVPAGARLLPEQQIQEPECSQRDREHAPGMLLAVDDDLRTSGAEQQFLHDVCRRSAVT